jgi:hypothetical protein
MTRNRVVAAAATMFALPLVTVVIAPTAASAAPPAKQTRSDVRERVDRPLTVDGKKIDLPDRYTPRVSASRSSAAADTPPVGTVREWLALDDYNGGVYRKQFTLRGVGDKIEVWVANDTSFPAGDCRAQIPNSTVVTDAQVNDLVNQFDTNMFPKETAAFSTPPDRDGSNPVRIPLTEGMEFTGAGDKTVTLVDNVRDDNYYTFPAAPTYIAGFFSSGFNELMDRNVMTVDAYDWAHRTGVSPADEPTADLCTSRPARPRLYEGTFAHEWQHLLQYYTDPMEVNWINEGLSDFAQTLVGYVDGTKTVYERGTDSHLYCFQGFGIVQTPYNTNPRDCGGPQNSLNLWGEGDPNALLADYGNAYAFMLFLYDRYGTDFMSRLHRDGEHQGLASLDAALESVGVKDMYQVLHDFQTMTLVDKVVGDKRWGIMLGVPKHRVTSASLRSTVNLANPQAYNVPGAAPNGADYIQLKNARGQVLKGRDLRNVTFNGAATLPPLPLKWTTLSTDPDRPGNSVLFSGNANNLDAAAVASVAVPTGSPTLTFLAKYGAEQGYDYGYVSVSTDGGKTYTAIPGDKTVAGPFGPALNGTTDGFEPHSYDLSAYAGQTVLVNFRYVSDGGVNEGGLLLDDIAVNGTVISDGSSLTPFRSPTQIVPTAVSNWNVRLVGLDEQYAVGWQLEFNGQNSLNLSRKQLANLAAFPTVVAIVAYDEPTEQVQQYAGYTLSVNGTVQPGGTALP